MVLQLCGRVCCCPASQQVFFFMEPFIKDEGFLSEQRFKNLVRNTSVAIIVLTVAEIKVEIVNEAYGRLIETKPNKLMRKPLFIVFPDAEEFYLPLLENVRKTVEMLQLFDSMYAVTVNGKLIESFLHVIYQPYRDSDGNILDVMAIMQDVTEAVVAAHH